MLKIHKVNYSSAAPTNNVMRHTHSSSHCVFYQNYQKPCPCSAPMQMIFPPRRHRRRCRFLMGDMTWRRYGVK